MNSNYLKSGSLVVIIVVWCGLWPVRGRHGHLAYRPWLVEYEPWPCLWLAPSLGCACGLRHGLAMPTVCTAVILFHTYVISHPIDFYNEKCNYYIVESRDYIFKSLG